MSRTDITNLITSLVLATGLISGCGAFDDPASPSSRATSEGGNNSEDAVNPDNDFGDDDFGGGGFDGADDGGSDAVDGGGDYEDVDSGGGKSLDDVLAECGDIDFDNETAPVLMQDLLGLTIVREGDLFGLEYRIDISPQLNINSSIAQSVTTVAMGIQANPAFAQSIAQGEADKQAGTTTTEFVPRADRDALFSSVPGWDGIVCTIQPAKRLISQVGGNNVVVEFDPPLPASFSPKADPVRYASEWQAPRNFTGIKATVVESTNEAIPTGTSYTGTVGITPINTSLQATDGNGNLLNLTSDLAFEINVNFNSPAITNALGLKPKTRFYIDHNRRSFTAIQTDIQDGQTEPVVFVGQ